MSKDDRKLDVTCYNTRCAAGSGGLSLGQFSEHDASNLGAAIVAHLMLDDNRGRGSVVDVILVGEEDGQP